MHQIKHILSACLILLMIIMGLFLYETFPEAQIVGNASTTIDPDPLIDLPTTKGQQIFQQNCGSCHSMNRILSAPALEGVTTRGPWSNRDNLIKWIKDPAAYINTDTYTIALQKKYNGITMPSFTHLTDEQINEVVDYISSQNSQTTY